MPREDQPVVEGFPFSLPSPDQIVLDGGKIMGIWRSHAGIHEEPQGGVGAVEGGLKEDRFLRAGVAWPRVPHMRGRGQLEEGYGHVIASVLPGDLSPRSDFSCRRAVHPAGELELRYPMPHEDSAGVALDSASDGVGVAEGAEPFLGGREGRAAGQGRTDAFLQAQRPLPHSPARRQLAGEREAGGLGPSLRSVRPGWGDAVSSLLGVQSACQQPPPSSLP